ncbi:hypothetical protein BDA99DRAFT_427152, partial [Phascolomyces articulosus]
SIRTITKKLGIGKSIVQEKYKLYRPNLLIKKNGRPKKIKTSTSTYLSKLVTKGKLPTVVDAYKYLRN